MSLRKKNLQFIKKIFIFFYFMAVFVYWVLWLFFVYNHMDNIIDHSTGEEREGVGAVLPSPLHSIVLYLRGGQHGLPCPESG